MNNSNKIVYKDAELTIFSINSKKYGYFEVKIDTEDIKKIKKYKWHINYNKNKDRFNSIESSPKFKENVIGLHKLITMNTLTDHINGDIFDNRKENLRECTQSQNLKNVKTHKDNKYGYKGIDKVRNKWRARITCNYKTITIGTYKNIEDALNSYNEKAIELFGEFARLNEYK